MNFLNWLISLFKSQPLPRPDNSGVIVDNQPTDYIAGVNSPIVYETRIPNGDWTPYAWNDEPQSSPEGDSMSCVTQSAINSIETQEFFMTGRKVNYSKRWIAKMSGTTRQGNYLNKVCDTIRKYGLVLDSNYPTPADFTFDQYYADINPDLLAKLTAEGQIWLQKWGLAYEFLQVSDPNLDYHLKHAPIQVVIPGHAICGIYSPDQLMTYLDSYAPWIKREQVADLLQANKIILTSKLILAREIGWQGLPELGAYIPYDNMERRKFILDNISLWIPNYMLDASKTYILPTKKPF